MPHARPLMTSATAGNDDRLAAQPRPKAFVNGRPLPEHRSTAHGRRHARVECSLCGAVTRADYMKLHMRTHGDDGGSEQEHAAAAASCDGGAMAETCSSISRHRSRDRAKNRTSSCAAPVGGEHKQQSHACAVCDRTFASVSALKDHGLTHSGERPHACEHCGRSFSLASNLRRHSLTHTGEKPHRCGQCGQAFSLVCNLRSHLQTHSGQRPFPCDQCGLRFGSGKDLRRHGLTHEQESRRPFVCQLCGRPFLRAVHLKSHELVHADRKPAVCDVCGLSFKSHRGLALHMRKHGRDGSGAAVGDRSAGCAV